MIWSDLALPSPVTAVPVMTWVMLAVSIVALVIVMIWINISGGYAR